MEPSLDTGGVARGDKNYKRRKEEGTSFDLGWHKAKSTNSERKASNQIRNLEGVGWVVIQTTIMRSRKNSGRNAGDRIKQCRFPPKITRRIEGQSS